MRIVGIPRDDQVTVIADYELSGTSGNIVLHGGSGASFSSASNVAFTYCEDDEDEYDFSGPVIDDVNPRSGKFGTEVIITGSKLPNSGNVYLAGTLAKIVEDGSDDGDDELDFSGKVGYLAVGENDSRSQIKVIAGEALPGTHGIVKVESSSDGSVVVQTTSIKFSYLAAFRETTITRIQPTQGFSGTEVTIYGSKLHGGDPNGIANVLLAGFNTLRIVGRPTDSEIKVVAGAAPPETQGVVTLQTAAGASLASDPKLTFQYWPEFYGISISSVTPSVGDRGTGVVIRGEHLNTTPLKAVYLAGGVEARIVGTPSATSITVVAGDAAHGTSGSISFESESGTEHGISNGWKYRWPDFHGFTMTSITPTKGGPNTTVVISGENLNRTPLKAVFLAGGVEARIIGTPSATSITIVAGDAAHGTAGPILFVSDSGTEHEEPDWAWGYMRVPRIISFDPPEGLAETFIDIVGEEMLMGGNSIASVTIAGIRATVVPGSAKDDHLTICAGSCKIDAKTKMGPQGPIVITGVDGRTITSSGFYQYNAKEFTEGQRMGLDNALYPERRGTFSLEKDLRRTAVSIEDAVDLSTGKPIAKQANNLGDRIEYGTYNQEAENKPTVLLRSKRRSVKGPSMLFVRGESRGKELSRKSKKEKANRSHIEESNM